MSWFVRALSALVILICLAASDSSAQTAPSVVFNAPAGERPAGPVSPSEPFSRILPSGRILHPTGIDVVVGMNALGVTLTPDGRYAIVSNDDERGSTATSAFDGLTTGGYSLAVVSTATMRVVSRFQAPGEAFFIGLAALPDPTHPENTLIFAGGGASHAVFVFDIDAAGKLTPDAVHKIPIPAPADARLADAGQAFPATLVSGAGGTRLYVVDNLANDVVTLDVATRTVVGTPAAAGYFPLAAAFSAAGLLIANEGLMQYAKLPAPGSVPPFALPAGSIDRSSSLSLLTAAPDGTLGSVPAAAVPMDRPPDGIRQAGGAHPAAIVTMRSKPFAFVAMSNVDRIATVALGPQPRVAGGTELRLYDRGPYGTQPDALALGRDERRLYVALAGINAIAVLDTTSPRRPHRIGLIPTGWFPSALALSRDGRYLYVANAKGFGEDRDFTGGDGLDSNTIWSTLERIDLKTVDLHRTTPLALSYLRTLAPARVDRVVPQERLGMTSSAIKHVVVLLEDGSTYDAVLGDLADAAGAPYGPGDPSYVSFDSSVTPNLHALARTFALAGNFYVDAEESAAGHQFAVAGTASVFTEKTVLVKNGRGPLAGANQDPEDYPRAGYIYNSLAARGSTFRDYGDLLRLSGYKEGEPAGAAGGDAAARRLGLGGLYSLDVPAPSVLAGHVDLNYPGCNPAIGDVPRAEEFRRDFDPLVKLGQMPAFTYVWLPGSHAGDNATAAARREGAAESDRALGQIVDYLSHTAEWSSTAIVIMTADAQGTRDHLSAHRSYAIVVSPYAKRHYLGVSHLSTVSALKTEEELLGLPALSLGDALATDMRDFFTPLPDFTPYVRIDANVPNAGAT